MKPLPLLVALAVLVILGGFVFYTEENPPASGDDKTPIVALAQDSIQKVTVTRPGKDPIVVERGEDDKWNFAAPSTVPADQSSVNSWISSLASMKSDRVVEENIINWAPFGLTGRGTVQVEAEVEQGKTYRVIFGSQTPAGANIYARLDGDPRLFTVFQHVKNGFEKEVFDLRDKRLLQVDDQVSRLVLKTSSGPIEFGKTGDDAWQILQPRPLRADNFTVGDLVRSVRSAEMMGVVEKGQEPGGLDFSRRTAGVEVVDEGGVHTLLVAKGSDDKYYAKSSDLEGSVFEISSTMAEGLDKQLEDFRNKKLFDFGFNEIAKLELRDGDIRVVVEKKEDKWRVTSEGMTSEEERELDSGKVQTAIDKLRDLTAKSFTSDNEADLRKYGLTAPLIEAKVALTEGSGDEVMISSPEKDQVYAARAGEPSAYEVEKSAVEAIRQAIKDLLKQEDPEEDEAPPPDKI